MIDEINTFLISILTLITILLICYLIREKIKINKYNILTLLICIITANNYIYIASDIEELKKNALNDYSNENEVEVESINDVLKDLKEYIQVRDDFDYKKFEKTKNKLINAYNEVQDSNRIDYDNNKQEYELLYEESLDIINDLGLNDRLSHTIAIIKEQIQKDESISKKSTRITTNASQWGNQNSSGIGINTFAQPNENYEDKLNTIRDMYYINSDKYKVVNNMEVDLIDYAKKNIVANQGIVLNNNITQNELNRNTTWYGSWQVDSSENHRMIKSKITNSKNSVLIKNYGTYFDLDTRTSKKVNLKIIVDYVDFATFDGNQAFKVYIRPNNIQFTTNRTEEIQISYLFTDKDGNEINAPILYSISDIDLMGSIGFNEKDLKGLVAYYQTVGKDTYDNSVLKSNADGTWYLNQDIFKFSPYYDFVNNGQFTQNQVELGTGYYTTTNRSNLNSTTNITNANGNFTPTERGWQRIKFNISNGYLTMLDSWSSNTGNSNSVNKYLMTTNGNEGKAVVYLNSNTTFTLNTNYALFNYPVGEGKSQGINFTPYNVAPVLNALDKSSGKENVVKSNDELIREYDIYYNAMSNSELIVDQSKVDYTKPGIYEITFIHQYKDGTSPFKIVSLYEVVDVIPTISSTTDVTLELGQSKLDYVKAFNANASEFKANDLTNRISVELPDELTYDILGRYNKTGDYKIQFLIEDDEHNVVTCESTLHIVRKNHDGEIISNDVDVTDLMISSEMYKSDYENRYYTDNELIKLFNIKSNVDTEGIRTLSIDQSEVDYTKPGIYEIVFTITDNITNEKKSVISNYEVIDVLPQIMSNNLIIYLNDEEIDYIADMDVVASEFGNNDIHSSVVVDHNIPVSSNGKYIVSGNYPITFTATDSDNNKASSTSILTIKRDIDDDNFDLINNDVSIDNLYLELENEEVELEQNLIQTDEELINLFNVKSNADKIGFRTLSIEQSEVDYTKPGIYDVIFTITDKINNQQISKIGRLKILESITPIEEETNQQKQQEKITENAILQIGQDNANDIIKILEDNSQNKDVDIQELDSNALVDSGRMIFVLLVFSIVYIFLIIIFKYAVLPNI